MRYWTVLDSERLAKDQKLGAAIRHAHAGLRKLAGAMSLPVSLFRDSG